MKRGLIIFARPPVPGQVKTRLARHLGDQAAAELYRAMLSDVLALSASLRDVRPLLFWALEGESPPPVEGVEMFRQRGNDLGERMANAFSEAFAQGVEICCIIGSDLPDLPASFVEDAFRRLEQDSLDAVFGPCSDGGYYLLGMRRLWPILFREIAWSTSHVLQTSLERAAQDGLRVGLLPEWHDVDTIHDLRRLAQDPGSPGGCRTRRVLEQLPAFPHFSLEANP